MVQIEEYKILLKEWIIRGHIVLALQSLYKNTIGRHHNNVVIIKSNQSDLDKSIARLEDKEYYQRVANKYKQQTLELIDLLVIDDLKNKVTVTDEEIEKGQDSEFKTAQNKKVLAKKVTDTILLVGNTKKEQGLLIRDLKKYQLGKIEIHPEGEKFDPNKEYDMTIFDNRHLSPNFYPSEKDLKEAEQQRVQLMQDCINKGNLFLLHLGEKLDWIRDHRERVQGANSMFSLYARIKEALEYLEITRKK